MLLSCGKAHATKRPFGDDPRPPFPPFPAISVPDRPLHCCRPLGGPHFQRENVVQNPGKILGIRQTPEKIRLKSCQVKHAVRCENRYQLFGEIHLMFISRSGKINSYTPCTCNMKPTGSGLEMSISQESWAEMEWYHWHAPSFLSGMYIYKHTYLSIYIYTNHG